MKCLKKKTKDGYNYRRVRDDEAPLLVAAEGWDYCSKSEFKRMTGEKDHG